VKTTMHSRLTNALVRHGLIDVAAIEDPCGYDNGYTLAAVRAVDDDLQGADTMTRNEHDANIAIASQADKRPKLTPAQRKALAAYEYALRQEDRYLGSVFVNAHGQRQVEARTAAAFAECKRLGMTWEHGL
jgi:hypothetical protein